MLRQASPHSWTGEYAVEAVDLVKDFAEKRAVDGVSLSVPTGSIFGMLGPNGAGKTTTLRMILGIIEPSSGERRVLGCTRPIEAAHRIGYLPEERGLYPAMNAREAIAFMGALRGLPIKLARSRADELLEQNGLGDWAKKPIRTLSKGMAQTVQLLGTLVHEPRVIVRPSSFRPTSSLTPSVCASGSPSSRRARSPSTAAWTKPGRGSARSSGCALARATDHGEAPCPTTRETRAASGSSSFRGPGPNPCSRR